MSLKIQYKEGALCLPTEALDACGDLLQVRLLMLLAYDRIFLDADHATLCERLDCNEAELTGAIEALRAVKLLAPEKKLAPSQAAKNYDGAEIAAAVEADGTVKAMIEECEKFCGKIFTPTDISKLIAMKNELGFDCATIVLLFFYLFEKNDAVGRKLNVSYAEKSAYSLYNEGIRSMDDLEKYIRRTEEKNSFDCRIRGLLGMGDRAFTKKEKQFFGMWTGEWQMSFDMIAYAYELTVNAIGKPGLEYMSKILSDWHASGITAVEQAEAENANFKNSDAYKHKFSERTAAKPVEGERSFDTDEFFEKAMARSNAIWGDPGDTSENDPKEGDT